MPRKNTRSAAKKRNGTGAGAASTPLSTTNPTPAVTAVSMAVNPAAVAAASKSAAASGAVKVDPLRQITDLSSEYRAWEEREQKAQSAHRTALESTFGAVSNFYVCNIALFYTRFFPDFLSFITAPAQRAAIAAHSERLTAGITALGTIPEPVQHLVRACIDISSQSAGTTAVSSDSKSNSKSKKAGPPADTKSNASAGGGGGGGVHNSVFVTAVKVLFARALTYIYQQNGGDSTGGFNGLSLSVLSDSLDDGLLATAGERGAAFPPITAFEKKQLLDDNDYRLIEISVCGLTMLLQDDFLRAFMTEHMTPLFPITRTGAAAPAAAAALIRAPAVISRLEQLLLHRRYRHYTEAFRVAVLPVGTAAERAERDAREQALKWSAYVPCPPFAYDQFIDDLAERRALPSAVEFEEVVRLSACLAFAYEMRDMPAVSAIIDYLMDCCTEPVLVQIPPAAWSVIEDIAAQNEWTVRLSEGAEFAIKPVAMLLLARFQNATDRSAGGAAKTITPAAAAVAAMPASPKSADAADADGTSDGGWGLAVNEVTRYIARTLSKLRLTTHLDEVVSGLRQLYCFASHVSTLHELERCKWSETIIDVFQWFIQNKYTVRLPKAADAAPAPQLAATAVAGAGRTLQSFGGDELSTAAALLRGDIPSNGGAALLLDSKTNSISIAPAPAATTAAPNKSDHKSGDDKSRAAAADGEEEDGDEEEDDDAGDEKTVDSAAVIAARTPHAGLTSLIASLKHSLDESKREMTNGGADEKSAVASKSLTAPPVSSGTLNPLNQMFSSLNALSTGEAAANVSAPPAATAVSAVPTNAAASTSGDSSVFTPPAGMDPEAFHRHAALLTGANASSVRDAISAQFDPNDPNAKLSPAKLNGADAALQSFLDSLDQQLNDAQAAIDQQIIAHHNASGNTTSIEQLKKQFLSPDYRPPATASASASASASPATTAAATRPASTSIAAADTASTTARGPVLSTHDQLLLDRSSEFLLLTARTLERVAITAYSDTSPALKSSAATADGRALVALMEQTQLIDVLCTGVRVIGQAPAPAPAPATADAASGVRSATALPSVFPSTAAHSEPARAAFVRSALLVVQHCTKAALKFGAADVRSSLSTALALCQRFDSSPPAAAVDTKSDSAVAVSSAGPRMVQTPDVSKAAQQTAVLIQNALTTLNSVSPAKPAAAATAATPAPVRTTNPPASTPAVTATASPTITASVATAPTTSASASTSTSTSSASESASKTAPAAAAAAPAAASSSALPSTATVPAPAAAASPRACGNPRCKRLAATISASQWINCAKCGAVPYCSMPCQVMHWQSGHRKACAGATATATASASTAGATAKPAIRSTAIPRVDSYDDGDATDGGAMDVIGMPRAVKK